VNVDNNKITHIWEEQHCWPSEPAFVPRPGATSEDDGVLLTVVLQGDRNRSFLLILDAITFEEIARAYGPIPLPFTSHGHFANDEMANSGDFSTWPPI
jgi:beta,beta-carotene 9',10'-dioxygenase